MDKTVSNEGLDDQTRQHYHIPFLAQLAGAKDFKAFYHESMTPLMRRGMSKSGLGQLVIPGILAGAVSYAGLLQYGQLGLGFGALFFLTNTLIQLFLNPLISERKAMGQSVAFLGFSAYFLQLISGAFAATILLGFLFKPEVDQRHLEKVATQMTLSQEKKDLDFAKNSLEGERVSLLNKEQVSTSAIDQATKAYSQAQGMTGQASLAYSEELTKGNSGRKAGDGPVAKKLRQALDDAQAAEGRALVALTEARKEATVGKISVPVEIEKAYSAVKERYQAKENALIAAGPGMVENFWWLFQKLKTDLPMILFAIIWAFAEASSVIFHVLKGRNPYEYARGAVIPDEIAYVRTMRDLQIARHQALASHKAANIASRQSDRMRITQARD